MGLSFLPLLAVAAILGSGERAAAVPWTTLPFNPTAIPLAVRSPYVSTWLFSGSRNGDLSNAQPLFWSGSPTPWCGLIRVDAVAYRWMGDLGCGSAVKATQVLMSFTASSTTFVLQAGGVNVTAVFLSPNTPNDLTRQSLPYSYLTVTTASNDGKAHAVSLYSDIDANWVSPTNTSVVNWSTGTQPGNGSSTIIRHEAELTTQTAFAESNEMANNGQVVYATANTTGTTWQTGAGSTLRATFAATGILPNTQDAAFRAIGVNTPAFGFASALGTLSAGGAPSVAVTYVVGHYRDPAVQWSGLGGQFPDRSLYFQAAYPGLIPSLSFFYQDYPVALKASQDFDASLQKQATSTVSADYAGLAALATRQVYSGLEITIGRTSATEYNTSDILAWTKEIATSDYISTVDVNYPVSWFFAYANPKMIRYIIEPVLQYTAKGLYQFPYVLHDLGSKYPIATGSSLNSYILEETGDMMVLAYAHAKLAATNDLIKQYYPTLLGWAAELASQTLYPASQVSTDDFAGAASNYTSLALKGLCGIQAMAKMAALVGETADAANYSSIAKSYAKTIQQQGLSKDGSHWKVTYQSDDSSWISAYNLFPDQALGLDLYPSSLYTAMGKFYPTVKQPYGVPLDSRGTTTKSDWALMTAAMHLNAPATRDAFVSGVLKYQEGAMDFRPFPDRYDSLAGGVANFVARPVIGAIFAPLVAPAPASTSPNAASSTSAPAGASPTSDTGSDPSPSNKSAAVALSPHSFSRLFLAAVLVGVVYVR